MDNGEKNHAGISSHSNYFSQIKNSIAAERVSTHVCGEITGYDFPEDLLKDSNRSVLRRHDVSQATAGAAMFQQYKKELKNPLNFFETPYLKHLSWNELPAFHKCRGHRFELFQSLKKACQLLLYTAIPY